MDKRFNLNHLTYNSILNEKIHKNKIVSLPYLKFKKKKFMFPYSPINKNKSNFSSIETNHIINSSQNSTFNDIIKIRKTNNYINLKKIKSASNIINKKIKLNNKTININSESQKNEFFLNNSNIEKLYYRIVLNKFKKKKREFIPNQFNLLYCENQNQFNLFEKFKNRRRIEKGKIAIHHIIDNKVTNGKINYMKDTLNKVSGILNYSYPKIFLKKFSIQKNEKDKIKNNIFIKKSKKENKLKNNSEIIDRKLIYKALSE